ncbi:MAG: hypothetical protein HW421_3033 [Ignavibacteria bacterium]|nr:hypothetical protein [Ignavibacteria bacterium]
MDYTISNHAKLELIDRKIPIKYLEEILSQPQQVIKLDKDKLIYQSIIKFENGKQYLIRIIVAKRDVLHIITIYRTSKINKYWSKENEN